MFSSNSQNYGPFYTKGSMSKASLTLSVLLQQNEAMKNKNFHGAILSNYMQSLDKPEKLGNVALFSCKLGKFQIFF